MANANSILLEEAAQKETNDGPFDLQISYFRI